MKIFQSLKCNPFHWIVPQADSVSKFFNNSKVQRLSHNIYLFPTKNAHRKYILPMWSSIFAHAGCWSLCSSLVLILIRTRKILVTQNCSSIAPYISVYLTDSSNVFWFLFSWETRPLQKKICSSESTWFKHWNGNFISPLKCFQKLLSLHSQICIVDYIVSLMFHCWTFYSYFYIILRTPHLTIVLDFFLSSYGPSVLLLGLSLA